MLENKDKILFFICKKNFSHTEIITLDILLQQLGKSTSLSQRKILFHYHNNSSLEGSVLCTGLEGSVL